MKKIIFFTVLFAIFAAVYIYLEKMVNRSKIVYRTITMKNSTNFYFWEQDSLNYKYSYEWGCGKANFRINASLIGIDKIKTNTFQMWVKCEAEQDISELFWKYKLKDNFALQITWEQNERDTLGVIKNIRVKRQSLYNNNDDFIEYKVNHKYMGKYDWDKYGRVTYQEFIIELKYKLYADTEKQTSINSKHIYLFNK